MLPQWRRDSTMVSLVASSEGSIVIVEHVKMSLVVLQTKTWMFGDTYVRFIFPKVVLFHDYLLAVNDIKAFTWLLHLNAL